MPFCCPPRFYPTVLFGSCCCIPPAINGAYANIGLGGSLPLRLAWASVGLLLLLEIFSQTFRVGCKMARLHDTA